MTDTALNVVNEFYASIHAGDFGKLFEILSDDCTIEYYGPSVIPFAGYFRGKEKCRIFFNHVAEDVNIQEFRQDEFISSDDKVAVTGLLTLEFKDTGKIYSSEYAHVITVAGNQIVRFRDFQNSALAAAVCEDVSTPER